MFSHWVWGISARQQHPFKIQSQYSEFALKLIPLFITEKKNTNSAVTVLPDPGSVSCTHLREHWRACSLRDLIIFFWRDFSAFVAACSALGFCRLEIFWAGMIPEKRSASSWAGAFTNFVIAIHTYKRRQIRNVTVTNKNFAWCR